MSTTLECDNRLRTTGNPDYGIGPDTVPETDPPIEQAVRFVEGTKLKRDFPGVKPVLADVDDESQLVVLVSGGNTVGLLTYYDDEQLGWHLAVTEGCSPSRRG